MVSFTTAGGGAGGADAEIRLVDGRMLDEDGYDGCDPSALETTGGADAEVRLVDGRMLDEDGYGGCDPSVLEATGVTNAEVRLVDGRMLDEDGYKGCDPSLLPGQQSDGPQARIPSGDGVCDPIPVAAYHFVFQYLRLPGYEQIHLESTDPDFTAWDAKHSNITTGTTLSPVPRDQIDKRLLIFAALQAIKAAGSDLYDGCVHKRR